MSATGTLISIVTFVGIYGLLAVGLNVKFGTTGILDFGHVAYYLIGAYTVALITAPPAATQQFQEYILGLNLPTHINELVQGVIGTEFLLAGGLGWVVAIGMAMAVAGFLGLVVALPAIRLRADYLAIALLGVSVILMRVVQTPPRDVPLVNGPDTMRGFSRPFNDLFPLPGDDLSGAILLGLVVMLVWFLLFWLVIRERSVAPGRQLESRLNQALLGITTLGVGYWGIARSRARRDDSTQSTVGPQFYPRTLLPAVAAAAALGLVAVAGAVAGLGQPIVLVMLGAASAAVWVVAWIKLRNHYHEYTWRSALGGLGIVVGVLIALAPAYMYGSEGGAIGYGASALTFVLLVLFGVALYNVGSVLNRYDVPGTRLGILGIATVWLISIRYFIVSLEGAGGLSGIVQSTQENLFWLVDFGGRTGTVLDYDRFLLILVIGSLALMFVLVQLVQHSPHGRVLKAVRDDENVAKALGKNSFLFKVQAMAVGSAIAGLAGAMWAIQARALSYNMFHPRITFFVFLAVILGGRGNHKGAILGAGMYWLLVQATSELAAMFPGTIGDRMTILRNAIIGLMIIALLYYRPEGIWKEKPPYFEVNGQ